MKNFASNWIEPAIFRPASSFLQPHLQYTGLLLVPHGGALSSTKYSGDLAVAALATVLVPGKHAKSLHILKEQARWPLLTTLRFQGHLTLRVFIVVVSASKLVRLDACLIGLSGQSTLVSDSINELIAKCQNVPTEEIEASLKASQKKKLWSTNELSNDQKLHMD